MGMKKKIIILLIIVASIFSVKYVYNKIVYKIYYENETWVENFYRKMKKTRTYFPKNSYLRDKCKNKNFAFDNDVYLSNGGLFGISYLFSEIDGSITKFSQKNYKNIELTYVYENTSILTNEENSYFYIILNEKINDTELLYIEKSYDFQKKENSYYVRYYQLTDNPMYLDYAPFTRKDATEIPINEVPEEIKSIDYKTKIDDIEKKIGERWLDSCNSK